MWSYVPKLHMLFLSNSLTHWFFPIYRTSAVSSGEMELQSSLDNSLHLKTLNSFHKELYLISYSSGKTKNNVFSLCHP